MEKRRILSIVGLSFFVMGMLFLFLSPPTITGLAVLGVKEVRLADFRGLIFLLAGFLLMVVAQIGGNLEQRIASTPINIYPVRRGRNYFVEIAGLNEISTGMRIQADYEPPIDDHHLNLHQLKELLEMDVVSQEDKERMKNTYGVALKRFIYDNFRRYLVPSKPYNGPSGANKEGNPEEGLKLAEAVEEVLRLLDPSYTSRKARIESLMKNLGGGKPYLNNPIREMKAAYVHYTSKEDAARIRKTGRLEEKQQALYFASLEEAVRYVMGNNQDKVRASTGATHTDTAIIFQPIDPPNGMNQLVGDKSGRGWKAFFKDLELKDCYTYLEKDVPKKV